MVSALTPTKATPPEPESSCSGTSLGSQHQTAEDPPAPQGEPVPAESPLRWTLMGCGRQEKGRLAGIRFMQDEQY